MVLLPKKVDCIILNKQVYSGTRARANMGFMDLEERVGV